MRGRQRRFWLRAAFVLAIVVTAVFGLRAVWFAWELSARADRPVAAWMTPRYILAVYDLDPAALAAVLRIDPEDDPRESVARLAAEQGRSTDSVLAEITALVDAAAAEPK